MICRDMRVCACVAFSLSVFTSSCRKVVIWALSRAQRARRGVLSPSTIRRWGELTMTCPFMRGWWGGVWPFVRVSCLAAAGQFKFGRRGARVMLEGKITPLAGAGKEMSVRKKVRWIRMRAHMLIVD